MLITRALLGKSVRGGPWFTSLDLKDVFLPHSYSQGSQEISLSLHERGICLTATAIHLLSGSTHLLIVCGGCWRHTGIKASRDKDIYFLYLNDLFVLGHSEEVT